MQTLLIILLIGIIGFYAYQNYILQQREIVGLKICSRQYDELRWNEFIKRFNDGDELVITPKNSYRFKDKYPIKENGGRVYLPVLIFNNQSFHLCAAIEQGPNGTEDRRILSANYELL